MAAFPTARRPGLRAPTLVIASFVTLLLAACGGDDLDLPLATATLPAALPTQPTLLESPTPTPTEEVQGAQEYTIEAGDTLSSIADQFGVTIDAIIAANELANPDFIQPGDTLTIPAPE